MLERFLPILKKLKGYTPSDFAKDAKAGVNVSLLDFPQSMAYAMIAGLPIQYGVHASALGSIISPFFASSRFLMIGPTNATAVLLMSGFLALNLDETQRLTVLPLLLLMVSVFTLAGRILRFEIVIQYVSRAVISGYITAAAFLIFINQVRHIVGVEIPRSGTFYQSLVNTIGVIPNTHWPVLTFSLASILLYFILKKLAPKLPVLALTILLSSTGYHLTKGFGYELAVLPAVSRGQWPLTIPQIELELVRDLVGTAFAITLLSILESTSISKTLAARDGDTIDMPQQFLSMSVASAANAFGAGMPISGSPTRSMLNYNSGARSPISSIISGLILVIIILFFSQIVSFIPKASLASLVIIVGLSLIKWDTIKVFLKTSRSDAATFLITFASGLVFSLDIAIYFGVGLSILLFLKKVSAPKLEEIDFNDRGELVGKKDPHRSSISIVHVEGDLFFGSTDVFLDRMRDLVEAPYLKVIILRMLNAHHIDATASLAIGNLVQFGRQNGRDIILSGVREDMIPRLEKSGLQEQIGKENIFEYTPENVTLSTRNALIRAQEIIGSKDTDVILMVNKKPKT